MQHYKLDYKTSGKRAMDLALTVAALPVLAALVVMILVLYFLTGNKQPVFRQARIGLDGKVFTLFKFRTLTNRTDHELVNRQFGLGKFLRLTSLDELPQFVNVLMGQMSIVGPRPLPVEYAPLFNAVQNNRHRVRPGITGWTQVNGRTKLSWKEKFELDLFYVENISLKLDLEIMLKTAALLLSFKKDDSLTENKFEGANE